MRRLKSKPVDIAIGQAKSERNFWKREATSKNPRLDVMTDDGYTQRTEAKYHKHVAEQEVKRLTTAKKHAKSIASPTKARHTRSKYARMDNRNLKHSMGKGEGTGTPKVQTSKRRNKATANVANKSGLVSSRSVS